MGVSPEQFNTIKANFEQRYLHSKPFSRYVDGVGRTSLREGETLDNLCLDVNLNEQPPETLGFPQEYEGVRVVYHIGSNAAAAGNRISTLGRLRSLAESALTKQRESAYDYSSLSFPFH